MVTGEQNYDPREAAVNSYIAVHARVFDEVPLLSREASARFRRIFGPESTDMVEGFNRLARDQAGIDYFTERTETNSYGEYKDVVAHLTNWLPTTFSVDEPATSLNGVSYYMPATGSLADTLVRQGFRWSASGDTDTNQLATMFNQLTARRGEHGRINRLTDNMYKKAFDLVDTFEDPVARKAAARYVSGLTDESFIPQGMWYTKSVHNGPHVALELLEEASERMYTGKLALSGNYLRKLPGDVHLYTANIWSRLAKDPRRHQANVNAIRHQLLGDGGSQRSVSTGGIIAIANVLVKGINANGGMEQWSSDTKVEHTLLQPLNARALQNTAEGLRRVLYATHDISASPETQVQLAHEDEVYSGILGWMMLRMISPDRPSTQNHTVVS